eukprot:755671-Hanusia_phi.AAC.9
MRNQGNKQVRSDQVPPALGLAIPPPIGCLTRELALEPLAGAGELRFCSGNGSPEKGSMVPSQSSHPFQSLGYTRSGRFGSLRGAVRGSVRGRLSTCKLLHIHTLRTPPCSRSRRIAHTCALPGRQREGERRDAGKGQQRDTMTPRS